jgi:hypothetical protein
MNSIGKFFIEGIESCKLELQLKKKLGELEIARLNHSPDELKNKMREIEDLSWSIHAFNKGLLFAEGKLPYAVNFINMTWYNFRIDSLKENLGYNFSKHQNI